MMEIDRDKRNALQRERFERVRAFEEAVRNLGYDHGFVLGTAQINNEMDRSISLYFDFEMIFGFKKEQPNTGETIRLDGGA